jgi:signal transduction histidine kinase
MNTRLSLRRKLIAVSILSVLIALAVSTFIDAQLAQRAFARRVHEDITRLAKELAAGFGGMMGLDDWETLLQKILQIKEARPDIRQISVFRRTSEGEWAPEVSDEERSMVHVSRNEAVSLLRGRTAVEQVGRDTFLWKITTPIRTEQYIIGALQLVVSWEAAQEDEARERRQTLLMLAATVVLVSITLAIFMQRAVYRPITRLVDAMRRAQAGSLDVEVPARGRDELAQLTVHFNHMLLKIRQDTAEKEHLLAQIQGFNEELQAKVQEATQILAQRNQELQRVNEALFQSQRQLAQWERLAGMVYQSAAIAHELGTPLHSITGYIQLLLTDAQLPDDARRRLTIIESQLDRISETLRTMLASTEQPTPQVHPLDLNSLLSDLLYLASPAMSLGNVQVQTSFQPDLPLVLADGNQLQQVFLNLIANALDAMPAGGELQVETTVEAASSTTLERPKIRHRRCITVRIRDTGQGIPEEHLAKIFDPFFTTKAVGRGTGIGLAVCAHILRAHGGTITVQSQLGKGSTFIVHLPIPVEG